MRRSLALVSACVAWMLGASVAGAGTLQSAALTLTIPGVAAQPNVAGPFVRTTANGLSGSSTGNSGATVAAGNAFFGVTADVPLTSNAAATNAHVFLGHNGRLDIAPAAVTITSLLTGSVKIQNPYGTLLIIPLALGLNGTSIPTFYVPYGSVATVAGDGWHTGQVKATGLTLNGSPLPDVTATGSFSLTPHGGGNITLVTIARVLTSTSYVTSTTAATSYLTLTFLPEPGSLLLLAAAAAALLATGRRRRAP